MKKTDFPYYLSTFLSHYLTGQKNCSQNTIESYATTFKLFFIFCEEEKQVQVNKITLNFITEGIIIDFLNWLEKKRNCSISTRNQRLVAIHSFFRYVQKKSPIHLQGISSVLEIPYKKEARTVVSYMLKEEMKILLEQPDISNPTEFRDLVLLSVLYDTAARVQELVDIRIKDIRLESPSIITLHGKGNKVRQVPIMKKTLDLLQHYLKDNKRIKTGMSDGSQYAFVNQRNQKLSRWGVGYIIDKYVKRAEKVAQFNVTFPITPHIFRHSKSMHMYQAGINIIYIRDFLGHVDCTTTEIYARADTEMKRKAIEAAYEDVLPATTLPSWKEDNDLMDFLNNLCTANR